MFPSSFTLHRRKQKTYHSVISDIFDGKLVSSVQVNIFSSTRDIKTTNRFYGIKSVINLRLAWDKIYYIRIYMFIYCHWLFLCCLNAHNFFLLETLFFLSWMAIFLSFLKSAPVPYLRSGLQHDRDLSRSLAADPESGNFVSPPEPNVVVVGVVEE